MSLRQLLGVGFGRVLSVVCGFLFRSLSFYSSLSLFSSPRERNTQKGEQCRRPARLKRNSKVRTTAVHPGKPVVVCRRLQ